MTIPHIRRTTPRSIAAFLALLALLYFAAATLAEHQVARAPGTHPFQTLLTQRGQQIDLLVIGSSHAMPLEFAGLPARYKEETGHSMLILAETGAGPLYALFAARQSLADLSLNRVLIVLDDFAFFSQDWNQARIADRDLLRHTPWRLSTARELWRMVRHEGLAFTALADYATGFSKINPPERFPQPGWVGQAAFDRRFRPSRHAIQGRAEYLFPDGTDIAVALHYLDVLERLVDELRAAGKTVEILRLPVAQPFRAALPRTAGFETALAQRLALLGVKSHDMRDGVTDPNFYFDPDHLNRTGVETLYETGLKQVLDAPVN